MDELQRTDHVSQLRSSPTKARIWKVAVHPCSANCTRHSV